MATRRSRRRSALKIQPDETASIETNMGRKKRVSFSTDLTELREFKAAAATKSCMEAPHDNKVSEKQAFDTVGFLNQIGLAQSSEDTVVIQPITTNNLMADQSIYQQPLVDRTMNFDNDGSMLFTANLKTSSTPQRAGTSKTKTDLPAKKSAQVMPVAPRPDGKVVMVDGFRNKKGEFFCSIGMALAHGEKRENLSAASTPREVSLLNPSDTDQPQAAMQSAHMDMTCLTAAATSKSQPKKSAARNKNMSMVMTLNSSETAVTDSTMEEEDNVMDITRATSGSGASGSGGSRGSGGSKGRRKRSSISQKKSKQLQVSQIAAAARVSDVTMELDTQDEPPVTSRRTSTISPDATETIELGRKVAVAAAMVEGMDISSLPAVKDMSVLKPRATFNDKTMSLVMEQGESQSVVKTEPKANRRSQANSLNVTQTLDSTNKPPSLNITDSLQDTDNSSMFAAPLVPSLTGRSKSGIQLEISSGIMDQSAPELTCSLADNEASMGISAALTPAKHSLPVPGKPPTNKRSESIESGQKNNNRNMDDLRKELSDLELKAELIERINQKKELLHIADKAVSVLDGQLSAARKKMEDVCKKTKSKNEAFLNMHELLSQFRLIEQIVLWRWEPQSEVTDLLFKLDVGVEFPIGTLRLKVSVKSLDSMIVSTVHCDAVDVLVGDMLASYRYHTLKRLLRLACEESRLHVGYESLPLLLRRLSNLKVKADNLLREIEDCMVKYHGGFFEFTPQRIEFRMRTLKGSCVYRIGNYDLYYYPNKKLDITCEPLDGPIPDSMNHVVDVLNNLPPGEKYISRICETIKEVVPQ